MSMIGGRLAMKVDSEGNYQVSGRISHYNVRQYTLAQIAHHMTELFGNINHQYERYMRGDGRLVGQEKANLSAYMDSLFYYFLILRLKLMPDGARSSGRGQNTDDGQKEETFTFLATSAEHNYDYVYVEHDAGFQISGEFKRGQLRRTDSFSAWFRNTLKPALLGFLEELKTAWRDHDLSPAEKKKLMDRVDLVLFELMIIHWCLGRGDFNR